MIEMTDPIMISGAAFVISTAAVVYIVADNFQGANRSTHARLQGLHQKAHPTQVQSIFTSLSDLNLDSAGARRNWLWYHLLMLIEQSDSKITIPLILGLSVILGALSAGTISAINTKLLVLVPAFLIGMLLPYCWLRWKRARRLSLLVDQLPDAFDMMRRAVRAGRTLPMAMQMVAKESPPLIAKEFERCCEQHELGLSQEVSLREMARRNDIMEFRIFVVAMLVQRISGGNPVDLLDNLAQRVRSRKKLSDRVRGLTSEGRMQAMVLYILPVAAFAAIYFIDRSYAQILLDRPRLIASLVAAQLVGAIWINRIVNFDY